MPLQVLREFPLRYDASTDRAQFVEDYDFERLHITRQHTPSENLYENPTLKGLNHVPKTLKTHITKKAKDRFKKNK